MATRSAKWTGAGVGICAAFLIAYEGFAPVAVHERVDPAGVITVCFGRTNYDDPDLRAGQRFTKEQCKAFLEEDLPKYAAPLQRCVLNFDAVPPNRQAALVSFSYNVGPVTACKSSVVRRMNEGDIRGGCEALMLYTRANGVELRGLVNRRAAERKLCLEGL